MKYETIDAAVKDNLNGTIYITRSIEEPCGPCCLGADHEVFAVYSTEEEALAEVEGFYKEHRHESDTYMMEIVKADVDGEGNFEIDDFDDPVRSLPDDQYWDEHGDEFDDEWECWVECVEEKKAEYEKYYKD